MIKIMLVDDHQMLRHGLHLVIEDEADMQVIAEAASGEEALQLLETYKPDVIVLDLAMPGKNGFQIIKEVRDNGMDNRIIVLSMHDDQEIVTEAIKLGADGIVPKSAAHIHLLEAIRTVHSGDKYLHPKVMKSVVDELGERQDKTFMLRKLSARELEVIKMSARGLTSKVMAETLGLSPKTIETYRLRMMKKLHLSGRSDLIEFALQCGLLDGASK